MMRGLFLLQAFVLARSYTPPTCSECVATEGMSWKVHHTRDTVDVKCVPTKECDEHSSPAETVMCFSENCGEMPDTDGEEWWYEGTRREDRCKPGFKPMECLLSSNKCAWVYSHYDGLSGEHCMFTAFALQIVPPGDFICPRPSESKGFEVVEFPVGKPPVGEMPLTAVEGVPQTCGECVAKPGYTWRVLLTNYDDKPDTYTASCIPTKECEQNTAETITTLCFPLHCDSLKRTREISDWWTTQVTEYFQCSPHLGLQACAADPDCAYIEENIHTGYCIFEQFINVFNVKDRCGYL